MGSSRFLLQAHVDAVYEAAPRRLAFKARTPDEFGAWQAALRQKTLALLGLAERTPPESVAAEKLQPEDRDNANVEEVDDSAIVFLQNHEAPSQSLRPRTMST